MTSAPRRCLERDDTIASSGSGGAPAVPGPLVVRSPHDPHPATSAGWELYRAGHIAEALAAFDVLLAGDRGSYEALLGRGRCHRLLRAYDDALADFSAGHAVRPAAARPLFERGAISILLGRYDDALADYRAAATRDPAYPGAASYFAELYLYTGRAGAALAISRAAICEEPTNVVHRVNVAHAYLLLGDAQRATLAYDAVAQERDPGKGITGAEIALDDLALMRSAGIEAPGMLAIEQRLRERGTANGRPSRL